METELERMVIRLVGDGSEYQKMLSEAVTSTQAASANIAAAANQIKSLTEGLKGFADGALKALSLLGVTTSLKGALDQFIQLERGQIRLRAAIESNGNSFDQVMPRYSAVADAISKVTLNSRGSVLGLFQQAEMMQLSGAAAERVVRNAVALGAATGEEASSMISASAAMERGNLAMVQRVLRLRGVSNQTELVTRINARLASGMRVAEAEFDSTGGRLERLGRSLKGLSSDLGGMVAEVIMPFVSAVEKAVNWFKALDPAIKKTVVSSIGLVLAWKIFPTILGYVTPLLTPILGNVKALAGLLSKIPSLWTAIGTSVRWVAGSVGPLVASIGPVFMGIMRLLSPVKLLSGAFFGVIGVLKMIAGVVGIVFSPVTILITAVVAVVYYLIQRLGGVAATLNYLKGVAGAVWDWISQKILAFAEWVSPIASAIVGVFRAAWDLVAALIATVWEGVIKPVFIALRDFAVGVWNFITAGAVINWGMVKDTIVNALLFAEFTLRNFGQVAEYVWTGVLLSFVRFGNQLVYFFVEVIPATFSWFFNNWRDIFTDLFNWTTTVFSNLGGNIVRVFTNLPGLIAGTTRWSSVWRPLTQGFQRVSRQLVLPDRVRGQLETQLEDLYRTQGAALDQSFEQFRNERLGQTPAEEREQVNQAGDLGTEIGAAVNNGAAKELGKFDAALAYSAEAITRIADYQERIRRRPGEASPAIGGVAPAAPAPVAGASPAGNAPAPTGDNLGSPQNRESVIGLLSRIATALEGRGNQQVILSAANLSGAPT